MASVSWVAGTVPTYATATSVAQDTPAGIADNDGVFAIVFGRSAVTPPAGWTLVGSQVCTNSTITQTLYIYQKDTVTAADSSTSFTFSQASSLRIGLCYAVVRGSSGQKPVVQEAFGSSQNSVATYNIYGGTRRAQYDTEMFLLAATSINAAVTSASTTPPAGSTGWTGSQTDLRLAGAYHQRDTPQPCGRLWTVAGGSTTDNGLATVHLRVRDATAVTNNQPYKSLTSQGVWINAADGTSYAFNTLALGTQNARRAAFLTVFSKYANGGTPSISVTINGASASPVASWQANSIGMAIHMYAVRVPTGTTMDVAITSTSTLTSCSIVYYTFYPLSLTAVDAVGNSVAGATSITGSDIQIAENGVMFCAVHAATDVGLPGFNGVDTPRLNNVNYPESTPGFGMADFITTESNSTRDASWSGASSNRVILAVSFGAEWLYFEDTLTDTVGLDPDVPTTVSYGSTLADVLTVLDNAVSRDPIIYEDVATDTIGMAVLPIPGRYVSLDDGLLASDALTLGYHLTLADIIGSKDVLAFTPVLTLTDAVGVTETLALKYLPGATVTETVGVLDAPAGAVKYLIVVSDRPGMRDATVVGVPASLSEGVGVQAAVATVRALKLAEALGVAEALGGAGKYGQTITDRVRLRDALLRFLSEDMLDTVNLAATLVAQRELYPTLTQGIGIDDATTQAFLLRVTATDEIELTATQALKMIFAPTVTDGVEITAAYISPNGNFTTWAINTRTAAVTEYSNYTFNSFAQTGHKYLGASDSGLYELNGDKDVNTDIIAHIKSGFAQFGGSRFTSFKAAYLGMRGEGDFILKLETGDGKTYTYAVVGKDMQTTRVHMGKGLRARYFSFELISTGQDFDLDDIEFLPLVVQRRV